MFRLIAILVLLLASPTGDGDKKGREGNRLHREEKYTDAATAFREGLLASGEAPGPTTSRLYNNLGVSQFRLDQHADSETAFVRSMTTATESTDFSRAAYNAGNASVVQEKLEGALDYYRQALLSDPTNSNARYNYEFIKRKLQEQQHQPDQQNSDQNQDQQNQDGDNSDQENQDQDGENQQQNQDGQDQDQQQQQQPRPQQNQMSREQAEQILKAMENDEKQLLQEVLRRPSRRTTVEKDW